LYHFILPLSGFRPVASERWAGRSF